MGKGGEFWRKDECGRFGRRCGAARGAWGEHGDHWRHGAWKRLAALTLHFQEIELSSRVIELHGTMGEDRDRLQYPVCILPY